MAEYSRVKKAVFVRRPNRFIAEVLVDGVKQTVHVKNTGRCKELLVEGCEVILNDSDNAVRKTRYDLIAVYKLRDKNPPLLINMDSQIPNDVAGEWLKNCGLFSDNAQIRREVTFGDSRIDFFVEDGKRKAFIEVKGVTLEENGIAMFPDAPTERGVKHINELVRAVSCGFEAYILFVIQMKEILKLKPNDKTHKAFGDALRTASEKGVKVIAIDSFVTENSITAGEYIEVEL